jgi:hypothetical protein
VKTFDERADADADLPAGHVVCATLTKEGKPVYFTAPADTSDDRMREIAFEIREGEPMSDYQKFMIDRAKEQLA